MDIQGDSRGEVSILGGDSIDHWENVRMNVCIIRNGYRDSAILFYRPNCVRIFLWIWMKSEVYKRRVYIALASFSRILDAAALRKVSEDQFR